MEDFIVPKDGFVVKTDQGKVILDLSIQDEGILFRMYDKNESPILGIGHQGNDKYFVLGTEDKSIALSSGEDVSEVNIVSSGKSINLAVAADGSEIRFENENEKMTNKIYIDEFGGQIGLADNEGNRQFSAGVTKDGGLIHLLNNSGNVIISLSSNKNTGQISLLDENQEILVYIDCSGENGVILLLDKNGHTVWSTIEE